MYIYIYMSKSILDNGCKYNTQGEYKCENIIENFESKKLDLDKFYKKECKITCKSELEEGEYESYFQEENGNLSKSMNFYVYKDSSGNLVGNLIMDKLDFNKNKYEYNDNINPLLPESPRCSFIDMTGEKTYDNKTTNYYSLITGDKDNNGLIDAKVITLKCKNNIQNCNQKNWENYVDLKLKKMETIPEGRYKVFYNGEMSYFAKVTRDYISFKQKKTKKKKGFLYSGYNYWEGSNREYLTLKKKLRKNVYKFTNLQKDKIILKKI